MDTNRHTTILDLARDLNVSHTTVWRAIHNRGTISEKTRNRIQAEALKRGYRPSMVAQNLLKQKTSLIGVLLPASFYVYVSILGEIEAVLRRNGYNVIVCMTNFDLGLEQQYIDMLMRRRVEGVIVLPTVKREHEEYSHFLQPLKSGMPVVFVDHHSPDLRLPRITTDDSRDVHTMTRHLIELGHRRIAFAHIGIRQWDPCSIRMLEGYKAALAEAGLEHDDRLVLQCGDISVNDAETCRPDRVEAFLAQPDRPDAIVAFDDMLAIKIMHVMQKMGVRIPADVAITGMANIVASPYTNPPLTTLERGIAKMAQRSAEVMVELLKKGDPFGLPVYECFAGELIVRESCGAKLKR